MENLTHNEVLLQELTEECAKAEEMHAMHAMMDIFNAVDSLLKKDIMAQLSVDEKQALEDKAWSLVHVLMEERREREKALKEQQVQQEARNYVNDVFGKMKNGDADEVEHAVNDLFGFFYERTR